MGLEELCSIIASSQKIQKKIASLLMCLRERPKTRKELIEELAISEKQLEYLISKVRKVGIVQGFKQNNKYYYYLSYDGFYMYWKRIKDTAYNLIKREKI